MSLTDKIPKNHCFECGINNCIDVDDVREAVRELKEKEKDMVKRFDDFCKCIDFGKCNLNDEAIVFMNDMFMKNVLELDEIFGEKLI